MSDDFPVLQEVCFLRLAGVFDDQGDPLLRLAITDNSAVLQAIGKTPVHDITPVPLIQMTSYHGAQGLTVAF